MQYTTSNPLRVITLCSGYDAQCLALERLKQHFPGFDYELVAWAEIDRFAIQAHNALFPQWADRNIGDITTCDWTKVPQCDLLTYSTPCTNVSNAGKREGITEGSGTASSILWSVRDAIRILRPRYLLQENVKGLVSKKFLPEFHKWQRTLEEFGYTNFTSILNAKDFGVPQNRERVFAVSILGDDVRFSFPKGWSCTTTVADILEEDVPEHFFLSDERVANLKLNISHDKR